MQFFPCFHEYNTLFPLSLCPGPHNAGIFSWQNKYERLIFSTATWTQTNFCFVIWSIGQLVIWFGQSKSPYDVLQTQYWINLRHVCQWIVSLLIPFWREGKITIFDNYFWKWSNDPVDIIFNHTIRSYIIIQFIYDFQFIYGSVYLLFTMPCQGKHISFPNSNSPNASFIFTCFNLQLVFHDLYNVFCFVRWLSRSFPDTQQISRSPVLPNLPDSKESAYSGCFLAFLRAKFWNMWCIFVAELEELYF